MATPPLLAELTRLQDVLTRAPHDPTAQTGGFAEVFDVFQDIAFSELFQSQLQQHRSAPFAELVLRALRAVGVRGAGELLYTRVVGTDFLHCVGPMGKGLVVGFFYDQAGIGMLLFQAPRGEFTYARLYRGAEAGGLKLGGQALGHA